MYVSAVDAGKLIGRSTRTIHRWIEQGKLQARHHGSNQLLILLADVEALATDEPEVVTPLSLLHAQAETAAELRARIDELLISTRQLSQQVTTQQTRIEHLEIVTRHEYEAHSILQKLLSVRPSALDSIDATTLREQRAEVGRLTRQLSVLEKRGLPLGSQTLSTFCKWHSGEHATVHPSTMKGILEAASRVSEMIAIYERPTASTYTHEWWVTPEQQHNMILFWQSHGKPFEPCPECPHTDIRVVEVTQESSVPA